MELLASTLGICAHTGTMKSGTITEWGNSAEEIRITAVVTEGVGDGFNITRLNKTDYRRRRFNDIPLAKVRPSGRVL